MSLTLDNTLARVGIARLEVLLIATTEKDPYNQASNQHQDPPQSANT
jgi:hypothetical protein